MRLAAIIVLLAASTTLGQVTFYRDGDYLSITKKADQNFYHINGVSVTFYNHETTLYSSLPDIKDLSHAELKQYSDGVIELTIYPLFAGKHVYFYDSFNDALFGQYGYVVGSIFWEIGQPSVLRSTRWYRLLDGTETLAEDGERDVACAYWLSQTDSDNWRARVMSDKYLFLMGDEVAYSLLIADHSKFSVETNIRVSSILDQ